MSAIKQNSFDDFLKALFSGSIGKKPVTSLSNSTIYPSSQKQVTQQSSLAETKQTTNPNEAKTPAKAVAQVTPQAKAPQSVGLSSQAIQIKQTAKTLQQIRRTSSFIKNSPKLFSGSNWALSAKLATQILRDCGVPIPKEIELSVAACQVIASGGAVVSAVNSGAKFSQVAEPSAAAIMAAISIGREAGLLNIDDEQMMKMEIASDVAMIVSSLGANVVADVKFVFDSWKLSEAQQASLELDVKKEAHQNLMSMAQPILTSQKNWLVNNFKDLAEGRIDMFEFASSTAYHSAEYFPRVFPELAVFFPPIAEAYFWSFVRGESSFVGINTHTAQATDQMTIAMDRFGGPAKFFDNWTKAFLDPLIEPYNRVLGEDLQTIDENGRRINNRISLNTLAIMSLLPPFIEKIDPKMDIRPYLKQWCLTPADFPWDDCIRDELTDASSEWFASEYEKNLPSPITLNGIDFVTTKFISDRELAKSRYEFRQIAMEANINGDIETLLKDQKCSELIKLWGQIRDFGASSFVSYKEGALQKMKRVSSAQSTFLPLPENDGSILSQQIRIRNQLMNGDWRDIRNYVSILSVIKFLTNKKVYSQLAGQQISIKASSNSIVLNEAQPVNFFRAKYPQLDMDIDAISENYNKIMQKTTFRRLNKSAFNNIAKILNVPVDKLVQVNKNDLKPDGPGIFRGA